MEAGKAFDVQSSRLFSLSVQSLVNHSLEGSEAAGFFTLLALSTVARSRRGLSAIPPEKSAIWRKIPLF